MRRVLAITLLIALTSPLVAPIFAATTDPEASLPTCCRRHGVHRCSMATATIAGPGPAFRAPPCPFYPTSSAPPRLANASLAAAPALSRTPLLNPTPQTGTLLKVRSLSLFANLDRGPPRLI